MQYSPSVHVQAAFFAHCVSVNSFANLTLYRINPSETTAVINSTKPGTVHISRLWIFGFHILRLWIFASLHLVTAELRKFTSRSLHQLLMSVCISGLTALVCRFKSSIAIVQARLKNKQKDTGVQKTRTLQRHTWNVMVSVCVSGPV